MHGIYRQNPTNLIKGERPFKAAIVLVSVIPLYFSKRGMVGCSDNINASVKR